IDVHNIGPHYDRTLVAWYENFDAKWPKGRNAGQERFYRLWKYYLLCCGGAFRARILPVWQVAVSTAGVVAGYRTARRAARARDGCRYCPSGCTSTLTAGTSRSTVPPPPPFQLKNSKKASTTSAAMTMPAMTPDEPPR